MDIDKALQDPGSHFSSPKQVLDNNQLSKDEKIALLRQWDYDTREILVAEEENMSSTATHKTDPGDLLGQIHHCLIELGVDSGDTGNEQDGGSQTKQG
jgi:hypothetical protein